LDLTVNDDSGSVRLTFECSHDADIGDRLPGTSFFAEVPLHKSPSLRGAPDGIDIRSGQLRRNGADGAHKSFRTTYEFRYSRGLGCPFLKGNKFACKGAGGAHRTDGAFQESVRSQFPPQLDSAPLIVATISRLTTKLFNDLAPLRFVTTLVNYVKAARLQQEPA